VSGDEEPRCVYSTRVRFWVDARDFSTGIRPAQGPTRPPTQGVDKALSLEGGVNRTAQSRVEVKYSDRNTFTPPYTFMAWFLITDGRPYVNNERIIPAFSPLR
jgi:hypothetical protein